MRRRVVVEAGKLDGGQHLTGLHRRPADHGQLIDEGIDRGHDPLAPPLPPLLVVPRESSRSPVQRIAPPTATRPSRAIRMPRLRLG